MACLVVLCAGLPSWADPLKPGALVRTIEFDPHTKAARLSAIELSQMGPPGWQALRKLIVAYDGPDPQAAAMLAKALVDGSEPGRHQAVADALAKSRTPALRGVLAAGLARVFPQHEEPVLAHLLNGGEQSPAILQDIAGNLRDESALRLLGSPTVGMDVYDLLRARDVLPDPAQLAPLAHTLAREGLSADRARAFAKRFASHSDFELLRALAKSIDHEDDAIRRGAHYLLLTLAGKRLPASADTWRSWIDGRAMYHPPAVDSEGAVEAAVLRGAHFLRSDLAKDGKALWRKGSSELGATALAVLALRAAGVPANDAAIEKAVRATLLVFGKGDRPGIPALTDREVYNLSLLAMALEAVDAKRFTQPLLAIRDRLVDGQATNGQWTYTAARGAGNLPPLSGDNSNTQYALLALRSIRRAGVPVPRETWEKAATHWQGSAHEKGGWHYMPTRRYLWKRRVSMTSAGIGSLAICLEALHGDEAAAAIERDAAIARAQQYLGELLLIHGMKGHELYAMYGVERAAMLTGTQGFKSRYRNVDWYTGGVRHLLEVQRSDGAWGHPRAKSDVQGSGYGFVVDTAYAILFLQKATATISKAPTKTVDVAIKDEKPPTPPTEVAKAEPPVPTPSAERPVVLVEPGEVYTNSDTATIRGRVTKRVELTVDGASVSVKDDLTFETTVPVSRTREVAVVAHLEGREVGRATVRAVLDIHPPTLELIGGPVRCVGKQTIRFRAGEALRGLRSGNLFAPADSNIVDLPVDLAPGKPVVHVTAIDRAGNESKHRFSFETKNRALALDGKSAVRFDLKEQPSVFTLECWFRPDAEPKRDQTLVANTERSGFGLFWRSGKSVNPCGYVHTRSKGYLICKVPRRPRAKRWHHLALTYDGKTARLFLNGKLQETLQGAPFTPSSRALFVGADPTGRNVPNSYFPGMIDEVRLSRVVRYVKNFKPAKIHGRDGHTVLLLHFDTDSEKAFFDDSRYGHPGRPAGAPRIVDRKR